MSIELQIALISGLCVALIILFLQQVAKTHGLKKDADALSARVSELSEKMKKEAAHYEDALHAVRRKYDEEIDGQKKKIESLEATHGRTRKLMELYADMYESEIKARESQDHYPPGVNPGL